MTASVQEQLLGHLLGALDKSEQDQVTAQLKSDPSLHKELESARSMLAPLAAARRDFDPSPGLADRTCLLVASQDRRANPIEPPDATARPARRVMNPQTAPPSSAGRIRWRDGVIAAGVCAAAVLLIIPAVLNCRFHSRLLACRDNLRYLGGVLTQYSEHHEGYFPRVPAEGRQAAAGIYAPILLRDNLLTDTARIVCPASLLAEDRQFCVASIDELQTASGETLVKIRNTMGGSYGYSFGYMHNGTYRGTRNLSRSNFALMADAPNLDLPGYQSLNHAGRGLNVLFEDRSVKFVASSKPDEDADDFFANDDGIISAGVHLDDSVVAPSAAAPMVHRDFR